jgi:phosphoribosyl 1,2-cyclic phosphodiesterase
LLTTIYFVSQISVSDVTPTVKTRNILIDCGKYFWASALRTFPEADIDHLDAVILTHAHADAFFGVDDLRDFANIRDGGNALPVYVREQDIPELSRAFPYLMNKGKTANGMHVPALNFVIYDEVAPFDICGLTFKPLPVHHGPGVTCSAFSFGNSIYMADVNAIPDATLRWILSNFRPYNHTDLKENDRRRTLDLLILDALWPTVSYNSHFSLKDAIEEFKRFRPRKGFTTGMSHEIEYQQYSEQLKEVSKDNQLDLELAWDGLRFEIEVPISGEKWPLPTPALETIS